MKKSRQKINLNILCICVFLRLSAIFILICQLKIENYLSNLDYNQKNWIWNYIELAKRPSAPIDKLIQTAPYEWKRGWRDSGEVWLDSFGEDISGVRILSHYCPPPLLRWSGEGRGSLIPQVGLFTLADSHIIVCAYSFNFIQSTQFTQYQFIFII